MLLYNMIVVTIFVMIEVTVVLAQANVPECKTEDKMQCDLPFFFGGKSFDSCMLWNKAGKQAAVCLPKNNISSASDYKKRHSTTEDLKVCTTGCPFEKAICNECAVPFLYNGKIYNSCIKWHERAPSYPTWCPTAVDLNNEFKNGDRHWGHCSEKCKYNVQIKSSPRRTVCKKCIFPFLYNGQVYSNCIKSRMLHNQNDTSSWCPIAVDENNEFKDVDRHWEYCSDNCNKTNYTVIAVSVLAVLIFIILIGGILWWNRKCKIGINSEPDQFEFAKI